ncbi:MAG: hypothetical protein II931_02190 [Clostridia bacterium]|nr:hypothetical protein [Clostridia bacterium]
MNGFKKFLNVFLIIIGVVLIAVCADLVSNKVVNTSYDNLSELDRNAIGDVCEVISVFDSRKGNKEVWDIKYNLRKAGCVITAADDTLGSTYTVNVDMSGVVTAQKIEMPDSYSDIPVYRLAGVSPKALSLKSSSDNIGHTSIKNKDVLYVKYTESTADLKGAGSLKESYVKNTFSDAVASPDSPTAEVDVSFDMKDVENIALLGLQYRIIDDMKAAKSKDGIKELVAEYVIVRDAQAEMYPEFSEQQQRIELVEGRTQYVFYRISDLTGDDMTYFNKEKSEAINFYSAYHYLCTGKYNDDVSDFLNHKGNIYVGAALCEVLDNNKIATDWEIKLDNSSNANFRSQYTLIKDYCNKSCGEYTKEKTLDDIKNEYNYDEILEMAKALVKGNAE